MGGVLTLWIRDIGKQTKQQQKQTTEFHKKGNFGIKNQEDFLRTKQEARSLKERLTNMTQFLPNKKSCT